MESALYRERVRTERRKEHRFAADIESMILWDGMSQPVTIKNISSYGALLHGCCFPPINTRVTLITDGLEVCGTVIWLGADQCGLLLSTPVEPLAVLRERPVRTAYPIPSPPITLHRIGPGTYA